jgi:hypothetical protein
MDHYAPFPGQGLAVFPVPRLLGSEPVCAVGAAYTFAWTVAFFTNGAAVLRATVRGFAIFLSAVLAMGADGVRGHVIARFHSFYESH